MSATTDYNEMCPLFDWQYNSAGVVFPFTLPTKITLAAAASTDYLTAFKLGGKFRLISADAYACTDQAEAALKSNVASTEPVIGIAYGTSGLASAGAGTEIVVITCDGAGTLGKKWAGTTTATTLATTSELWVYIKTAAVAATTANLLGAARIVLWLASMNSPA